jgi:hypothetical protein
MLEYRWQFGSRDDRRGDVGAIENRVVSCFIRLTLQLSETQLKPVLLRLLHWGNSTPQEIASGSAVAGANWRFASLCRRIAMYHVLEALADTLKSIFTPYLSFFIQVCDSVCVC